jgi:hypothetical protein
MKSKTFIGRVHALVESGNGGLQVFACDHKHPRPGQRTGLRAWRGVVLAKRELDAYRGPGDVQAIRDAVA